MASNNDYRYDKVTMGVLMRDFVFDRNAPKAVVAIFQPRALHNAVSALRCEADIRLGFGTYLARR